MNRTLYLQSYDLYADVLEYKLQEGDFAILSRDKVETLGIALSFGAFCREGPRVAGIFATPQGPVLFLDAQWVVGRFGQTSATVKEVPGQTRKHFTLTHRQPDATKVEFSLIYETRLGLGANPYDNEEEDIDLLAMITSGLGHEAFYRAYTRDWVSGG